MMINQTKNDLQNVDRDPNLFMGFLTLIVIVMYVMALITVPTVRQPITLIVFTALIIIHVALHWSIAIIAEQPFKWVALYIFVQGLLAFFISVISGTAGMIFALYMGLIGESVGLLGLKRRGLVALSYYLLLAIGSFLYFFGISSLGGWVLATVPIVVFVVIYVTLYMRQTEARAQAQALLVELEKANQQLTEYADRVEDLTIANERQRMARELHDTLSQGLAGLILQLEAADANLVSNRTEKARDIILQSMEQARTALEASRRAIDNLRQPEPIGLEDAIRQETLGFSNNVGIPCEIHLDLSRPVPETVQEAVIRSLSEALNNIARHSDATHVELTAKAMEKQLDLTIKDNGRGFDPDHIPAGHYGILGIRERIRLAGGSFEIMSSPNNGTILKIQIPIEKLEE